MHRAAKARRGAWPREAAGRACTRCGLPRCRRPGCGRSPAGHDTLWAEGRRARLHACFEARSARHRAFRRIGNARLDRLVPRRDRRRCRRRRVRGIAPRPLPRPCPGERAASRRGLAPSAGTASVRGNSGCRSLAASERVPSQPGVGRMGRSVGKLLGLTRRLGQAFRLETGRRLQGHLRVRSASLEVPASRTGGRRPDSAPNPQDRGRSLAGPFGQRFVTRARARTARVKNALPVRRPGEMEHPFPKRRTRVGFVVWLALGTGLRWGELTRAQASHSRVSCWW